MTDADPIAEALRYLADTQNLRLDAILEQNKVLHASYERFVKAEEARVELEVARMKRDADHRREDIERQRKLIDEQRTYESNRYSWPPKP